MVLPENENLSFALGGDPLTSEEWHKLSHAANRNKSGEVNYQPKQVLSSKKQRATSLEREFTPISENSMSSIEADQSVKNKELVATDSISNGSSLAEAENFD